ncbi:hypothetical protein GCM10009801_09140 [Streptomyces albiaxialis]|uniref:MFS transporter n=1 Tax=Streptomyces albiaxialis TaxID=329523 RepID=A0ABN2VK49_9ACTN
MSARHRLRRPAADGTVAGIVLATANVLGLGLGLGALDQLSDAPTAVAPDIPPAEEPHTSRLAVETDGGPAEHRQHP